MRHLMRTAAATLVVLGITGLLPLAAPAQTIGFKERSQDDIWTFVTPEHTKCMSETGAHLKLVSDTDIPSGTEVMYLVTTVEGPDIFRNHGVEVWLADGSNLSELPGNVITGTTSGSGTEVYLPGLCWADNRIDSNHPSNHYSLIEVQLLSVAGFAIEFATSSARYGITDHDICERPDEHARNQGIVYQRVGGRTCTCTTQSTIVRGGIAQGETESYATTALNWRTDSTNYCPDSPYQRPGS